MATLRDAIYGLAVGDALGVPAEFKSRGSYQLDGMTSGGMHGQPAGTFSDDTSMALACCDSIRAKKGIDVRDMRRRFDDWRLYGTYAIDNAVFDIGTTVAMSLAEGKGRDDERSNGNGSLMRIVPLAFVDGVTDQQIADVSAITHAHPISIERCVLYVRLAQDLIAGTPLIEAIRKLPREGAYKRLHVTDGLPLDEISSSGYVVSTFEAALLGAGDDRQLCGLRLGVREYGR